MKPTLHILLLGLLGSSTPLAARADVDIVKVGNTLRSLPLVELDGENRQRVGGEQAAAASAWIDGESQRGLPEAVSLRSRMSPVRDQGERSTCSAFAAIALMEVDTDLDLSEQCLARFSSERDSGWAAQRLSWAIGHGVFLEASCPYFEFDRERIPVAGPSGELSIARQVEMLPVTSFESMHTLKQRLAAGRPVAIAVWVSSPAFYEIRDSVITPPAAEHNLCAGRSRCGAHAIVVTGYDDAAGVLEFKNSWGDGWKDGGYGRMSYDYFLANYLGGTLNRMVVLH